MKRFGLSVSVIALLMLGLLPAGVAAAVGEVFTGSLNASAEVPSGVLDLPLVLADWEPAYPLAEYEADRVHFPAPPRAGSNGGSGRCSLICNAS